MKYEKINVYDLVQINSNIDAILNSNDFLNLSEIEQNILIGGAETYIDSFTYWSNNESSWTAIGQSYNGNLNKSVLTKGGFWGNLFSKKGANADAKGAIAGGIGGAIGGAVVGTAAGGIGAGPGALVGFVGGAISGGIGNSILTALNSYTMIDHPLEPEKTSFVHNLAVPEIWTKVAFDSTNTPSQLSFSNGLILVEN